jgi:hypothetical protein
MQGEVASTLIVTSGTDNTGPGAGSMSEAKKKPGPEPAGIAPPPVRKRASFKSLNASFQL